MKTTDDQREAIKILEKNIDSNFKSSDSKPYAVDDIFAFLFLDILDGLFQTMIESFGYGVLCLACLTLVFLGSLRATFIISALLLIVDVCVYAIPFVLGFEANIASYMMVVISFGLVVNFFVHFMSTFEHMLKKNTNVPVHKSVEMTMVKVGPAMLLLSVTSILSVLPMMFSTAPLGRILSQVYSLIMVNGLWHGIIVLPVALCTGFQLANLWKSLRGT